MAFSDVQLEDIRERADLVQTIGKRVTLKKTGKDWTGLCPFHGERTPSFYVVPQKRMWHCFGCGESGDVFKFFMKLDGMNFMDAVKQVAEEAGVALVEEKHDPEEAKRRAHLDELAALLERAVEFYEKKLWVPSGKPARDHLKARGVSEEMCKRFHLGFAGTGMDELSRALEKAQANVPLAIEAGLLIPSSRGGRPFDRFHGRLIVPIRVPKPPTGRSIALGGRYLKGITPEPKDRKAAKYINSPETPLYQKGTVLYGMDQARDLIRKEERAIIVEGYFDVIGVHQAGLPMAIATCGTSLTSQHLELLTRTGAKEIVFLFDGDAAGLKAAHRAAEMCAKAQVPGKVATLPEGLDPDEFARQRGLEGLQALLERARPAIEVLIDSALSALGPHASVEERVRAVQEVKPVVMAAPAGLSRELYISQIAERMGTTPDLIRLALQDPPPRAAGPRTAPGAAPGRFQKGDRKERREEPAAEQEPLVDPMAPLPEEGRRLDGKAPKPTVARQEANAVLARRTLPAEEGITLALLKFPVLAATVAQEGILGDFANPALRSIAEGVLAAVQAGEPVLAGPLLERVGDAALRAELQRKLADDDANLETSADHLGKVVDRLRKEVRRGRAKQAVEQAHAAGDDEAARKAFLEEQQRNLEESRRIHAREQERSKPKG